MFCPHCGKPNKESGKFCVHCGKPLAGNVKTSPAPSGIETPKEVSKVIEPKKIEKWQANVKSAGLSAYAFGWIQLVIYSGLTIWYLLDSNFNESGLAGKVSLSGWVLTAFISFIFIVLGKRVSKLSDIRIKRYLGIISVLTLVLLALAIIAKGGLGIIFILLLVAVFRGATAIDKLMKVDSFKSQLSPQKNRITTPFWIVISVIFIVSLLVAAYFEPDNTVTTNTTSTNELSKQELIHQAVESAKSETTFPNEIDEVTTFSDIVEQPGAIRYVYTLHDADEAQLANLTNEDLKASIAPSVCSTPETRNNFIDKDINLEYQYNVKDSSQTFLFVVSKADCA